MGSFSSLVAELKAWLAAPFNNSIGAGQLTLSIGLVIIIILFWMYILNRLEGET